MWHSSRHNWALHAKIAAHGFYWLDERIHNSWRDRPNWRRADRLAKKRRTYLPRIVGDKVMMPADLKRLHKYMLDVEHIGIISDEMRQVVEELWPELAHKLPPKKPQGWLRVRRERPRGRSTAEYGDEIAPFHCPMSSCFRPKG